MRYLLPAVILFSATPALADNDLQVGFSYQVGQPVGTTFKYIGQTSPLGIGVDVRWTARDFLQIGIASAWNVFYEQTDGVITVPFKSASTTSVDISGHQWRYLNVWPLLANASLCIGKFDTLRVCATGNVGAYFIERRFDIGIYTTQEFNAHFGFAPEASIMVPLERFGHVFFAARYNYAVASGNTPETMFFGFHFGYAQVTKQRQHSPTPY